MKYPLSIPLFQSTLPRRERLFLFAELDLPLDISIHAPAKGATKAGFLPTPLTVISIHAPAKGATDGQTKDDAYNNAFQSTLPRRERPTIAKR